ncbi:hypothetical protein ACF0HZ_03110 [Leuconostoc suionicum]|uniref:hypothetical protein n=1 Tax=Leuconostoc suionicum TaxID=1511761 RepID=UPI00374A0206
MEKKQNIPKIIAGLKADLTPFARKNSLSTPLSLFYLQLTSQNFADTYQGLAYAIGMSLGGHKMFLKLRPITSK